MGYSEKVRWTYTLIACVEKGVEQRHGELSCHLVQTLTGHGGYTKCLLRFRLKSPNYRECAMDSAMLFSIELTKYS